MTPPYHNKAVYAMADALRMTIHADQKTGALKGVMEGKIDLMEFACPLKIELKDAMHNAKASFALAHVKGNLAFLLAAGSSGNPFYLFVLNIAKMDGMSGWFEKNKPASSGDAARILGDAVVARFEEKNGRWHPLKG